MSARPLTVSVIVPVYDGAAYLAEALDSIACQERPADEVLVVDDGSTDGSAAIARGFPGVRVISQPNQGHGGARNTGIAASSGDVIAFLDADDRWTPDKLRVQLAHLEAHPAVEIVLARQRMLLEGGLERPAWMAERALDEPEAAPIPSALVARRSVFDRVGGFDPSFRMACDTDWLFRARDAGVAIAWVADVLVLRRVHRGNMSNATAAAKAEFLRVLHGSVRRHRERQAEVPGNAATPGSAAAEGRTRGTSAKQPRGDDLLPRRQSAVAEPLSRRGSAVADPVSRRATGVADPLPRSDLAEPRVSVIIPAFEAERFLGAAIESALAQEPAPFEVLVVDDGSTDGTAAVARSHDVGYVRQENGGVAAAVNLGVSLARGELLAFVDADDVWLPGKLAKQLARLGADPSLDAVFGRVREVDLRPAASAAGAAERREGGAPKPCEDGASKPREGGAANRASEPDEDGASRPREEVFVARLTMLVRRESFQRVGPFDPRFRVADFVEWFGRAAERGFRHEVLPDVVAERRIHGANMGIVERERRGDYLAAVRSVLERRRRGETGETGATSRTAKQRSPR